MLSCAFRNLIHVYIHAFPSISEGRCPDCPDRSSDHGTKVWDFWTSVRCQRQTALSRCVRVCSVVLVTHCLFQQCHCDLFTVDQVCQHSSRLKHATSINTASFFSVDCPPPLCLFHPYRVTCLVRPEAFVWRVNYGWVMCLTVSKTLVLAQSMKLWAKIIPVIAQMMQLYKAL